jgi:hypothetical protein
MKRLSMNEETTIPAVMAMRAMEAAVTATDFFMLVFLFCCGCGKKYPPFGGGII